MFDLAKQKLFIAYLISSPELFIKVNSILKPGYFDPELKKTVAWIQDYFSKYNGLPSVTQLSIEQKLVVPEVLMNISERAYAENELETFCKDAAITEAIYASVNLLQEGNYGEIEKLIRSAITISLTKELGTDYAEDVEERLNLLSLIEPKIATGFEKLDDALAGGQYRKGLFVYAAPPGVGKSLTMSNIARNMCLKGYHGVYISLELSEEMVCSRFDTMFTGIPQWQILKDITKTGIEVRKATQGMGSLKVKRLPESSTNAHDLRAYLSEYELETGRRPDFVVLDYLDLMACTNKSISPENQFIKDKYVSEELRAIANDLNLIMITASQLNRGALEMENMEELTMAKIAGGISKMNTADASIAIIQTPQMKARNEMVFKILKSRSSGGTGTYFIMKFDPVTLRMQDLESDSLINSLEAIKQKASNAGSTQWGSVNVKSSGISDDDIFQV